MVRRVMGLSRCQFSAFRASLHNYPLSQGNATLSKPIDLSASPLLARLMIYWQEKRQGRAMPSRNDIDPLDVPYILGNIALVDVVPPAAKGAVPSFRFRLYGANLAQRLGGDMTGKRPSDHPDSLLAEMMNQTYGQVVKTHMPGIHQRYLLGASEQVLKYLVLILPLSREGKDVDMLLVAVDFDAAIE